MSKQVSQARIEANRRNAQRSTGPRTPEGKATSSRNAFTHGLLSESSPTLSSSRSAAIGPVTDPNHAALVNALIAELRPSGTIETALVASLASLRHRLNRITAIESGLFEESMVSVLKYQPEFAGIGQETFEDCIAAPHPTLLGEAYGHASRRLNLLTFYEARLNREFHRALAELRRTQALRFASESNEQTQESVIAPIPTGQEPVAAPTKSSVAVSTREKEQTNPTTPQPAEITSTFHPDAHAANGRGQENEEGL